MRFQDDILVWCWAHWVKLDAHYHGLDEIGWAFEKEQHELHAPIERLRSDGLIEIYQGHCINFTRAGLDYIESSLPVDSTLWALISAIRTAILKTAYEKGSVNLLDPVLSESYNAEVALTLGHHNNLVETQGRYLERLGYIEIPDRLIYIISEAGREYWERSTSHERLCARWEELNDGRMTPQERGHSLEDLLADIATFEEAVVSPRAIAKGEENDLIVSWGVEHWLLSCKWEKKPTSSTELDIVQNRVRKRPGVIGVLVSVNGFSANVVPEAESNTANGIVVLMGRGDIQDLVEGKTFFRELLIERYRTFVTNRKMVFKE